MESEELYTEQTSDDTSSPSSTPLSLKNEKLLLKEVDKEKNRHLWMCRPTLAAIAEEWNQVPTVGVNGSNGQVICTMLITVDEAFCHLRSSDLPEPTEEVLCPGDLELLSVAGNAIQILQFKMFLICFCVSMLPLSKIMLHKYTASQDANSKSQAEI